MHNERVSDGERVEQVTSSSPGAFADVEAEGWAERWSPNDEGLVPAVVQEATTRQVLMLAWMDREALNRTLVSGRATYWSRRRRRYWVKGETSGHAQHVREVRLDCDGDTVLLLVDQVGAACHTGAATCFDETVLVPADDNG